MEKKKSKLKKGNNSCKNKMDQLSLLLVKVAFLMVKICSKFQVNIFNNNRDMSQVKVCHTIANTNANTNTDNTRSWQYLDFLFQNSQAKIS